MWRGSLHITNYTKMFSQTELALAILTLLCLGAANAAAVAKPIAIYEVRLLVSAHVPSAEHPAYYAC